MGTRSVMDDDSSRELVPYNCPTRAKLSALLEELERAGWQEHEHGKLVLV